MNLPRAEKTHATRRLRAIVKERGLAHEIRGVMFTFARPTAS
jgi:hypothetical protein